LVAARSVLQWGARALALGRREACGRQLEPDPAETGRVENELLAWKSVPGSTVANEGIVRFLPNDDGTTRVDIKLSYNPPAGAI
jgi:uncharacterized membrane protein